MTLLFTLLSIWYTWIGLRTLHAFWRRRDTVLDDDVTADDRRLLDQGAFFLLIPIGVLFHEVGHAAATWQVGGDVERFRWFIFWGYVLPSGTFSPLEDWWIGLAGNLVSVVLAFVALAAVRPAPTRGWRYWLLSFTRLQLFYALIFYPGFSIFTGFGDWVGIYGPLLDAVGLDIPASRAHPELMELAIATAVAHVGLLAAWAWVARRPATRRWMLAQHGPAGLADAMTSVRSDDPAALTQLADRLLRADEPDLAADALAQAAEAAPTAAGPRLALGRLELARQRPDRARKHFEAALERASSARHLGLAHHGLAMAALITEDHERAADQLDRAVAQEPGHPAIRLSRAQLRWARGDREGAEADRLVAATSPDPQFASAARGLRDDWSDEEAAAPAR